MAMGSGPEPDKTYTLKSGSINVIRRRPNAAPLRILRPMPSAFSTQNMSPHALGQKARLSIDILLSLHIL
jgi:hypothetical protein